MVVISISNSNIGFKKFKLLSIQLNSVLNVVFRHCLYKKVVMNSHFNAN